MNRYASFGLALALILGLGTLDPVAAQSAAGGLSGSGAASAAGQTAQAGAQPTLSGGSTGSPAQSSNSNSATSPEASANFDETLLTFSGVEEESGAEAQTQAEAVGAFGIGDLLRMILVLALILAAIYGIFWFIRKSRKLGANADQESLIRLQDQITLGGTRTLQVIEIGAHNYLLGVSDAGIQLLCEITDEETKQELRLRASKREAAPKAGFAQLLDGLIERGGFKPGAGAGRGNKKAKAEGGRKGLDFLGSAAERLKKW